MYKLNENIFGSALIASALFWFYCKNHHFERYLSMLLPLLCFYDKSEIAIRLCLSNGFLTPFSNTNAHKLIVAPKDGRLPVAKTNQPHTCNPSMQSMPNELDAKSTLSGLAMYTRLLGNTTGGIYHYYDLITVHRVILMKGKFDEFTLFSSIDELNIDECLHCNRIFGPRNIQTPGPKFFEIFGPPLKYFISP